MMTCKQHSPVDTNHSAFRAPSSEFEKGMDLEQKGK